MISGTERAPLPRFVQVEATKEEVIKKVLSGMAIVAALRLAGSVALAQDLANGEKTLKAKCAGHGRER